jgi:hypothetical protein
MFHTAEGRDDASFSLSLVPDTLPTVCYVPVLNLVQCLQEPTVLQSYRQGPTGMELGYSSLLYKYVCVSRKTFEEKYYSMPSGTILRLREAGRNVFAVLCVHTRNKYSKRGSCLLAEQEHKIHFSPAWSSYEPR